MALLYVFIASLLAATVNLCLRKNLERQKSAQGYLSIYFIFSLGISFALRKVEFHSFSFVMTSAGTVAGLLNFLMMGLIARSLKVGPSGLTFAFQNSASILPTLLLFFIFGAAFAFKLTIAAMIGFCLIVAGLFFSSRMQKETQSRVQNSQFIKWITFVIALFLLQGIILSLFQWRCLLLTDHAQSHVLIPWRCTVENDPWFMPGFFLIPAILQTLLFFIFEKRWLTQRESLLGIVGGVFNGGATFFLLLATKLAGPNEKMILFPFFAVSVIFLCNLWGKKLYQEKIHWPGMVLCFAGVLIGAI